jgi:hypothetical protein
VVEQIRYDRHLQQARLRLSAGLAPKDRVEIVIFTGRKRLVERVPPEKAVGPSAPEQVGRLPRITKLMALAIRLEGLLQQGAARDYADLARLGGVSRARITQILNLRNLAPVLQERLLELPAGNWQREGLTEKSIRQIAAMPDWRKQISGFNDLLERLAGEGKPQV